MAQVQKKANESKVEKIIYDPKKKYTWEVTDSFVLNGGEFGLILNTLRAIINTEEASKILMAHQASQILEKAMADGVESGVIKEAPENV